MNSILYTLPHLAILTTLLFSWLWPFTLPTAKDELDDKYHVYLPFILAPKSSTNSAPNRPSNLSPANASTIAGLSTVLTWSGGDPDGDSVTYDVYFESWNDSPNKLVSNSQSGASYTLDTLADNTTYYWKIIAMDQWGKSIEGPVWSFSTGNQAPETPNSPNPASGAIDLSRSVVLQWSGGDLDNEPVTYDVYFESGDETPDVLVSNDQSATSYTPGTLEPNTTYYWQIITMDQRGKSTGGSVWHFTTEDLAPNAPNSPTPDSGAIDQPLNVTLQWIGGDQDNDSVTYDVYLEAGDNTPDILVSNDQSTTSYTTATLKNYTTYFWQVIATDQHNKSTNGPVWSFTTVNQAPFVPSSPKPAAGDTNQSRGVMLSWTGGDPENDILTYDVYLAAGDSNPNILVSNDQNGTSCTPAMLDDNTTYYWKVIATDQWGKSSESPVWSFTVNNLAPVITDPFPINEDWGLNVEVNLNWSASDPNGDAITYDVYLEIDDSTPDTLVASHMNDTNFDPGPLLAASVPYYWRVVATDAYGLSTSSPIWHFSTAAVSAYVREGKISTGGYHTCGLTQNGALMCWGSNSYGQVGIDPSTLEMLIPTVVPGFTSGVIEVAAGQEHTCALNGSGGVKCWGRNNLGQLGDGTTVSKSTPVDVVGLTSGVVHIATSYNHTCAVLGNGGVKCWGNNYYGQLGNGTQTNQTSPVDVYSLNSGIIQLTTGQGHSCALTRAGGVKCWGNNNAGQLGNGTQTKSSTPVDVYSLSSGVSEISAGRDRSYAIVSGRLRWWGRHFTDLELDTSLSAIPKDESYVMTGTDQTGVVSVEAGDAHTCVVMSSGNVKCWGDSHYSQVSFDFDYSGVPVIISGLTRNTTQVSAGYQHTCVLNSYGVLMCWGNNSDGQVGDGSTRRRIHPTTVVNYTG